MIVAPEPAFGSDLFSTAVDGQQMVYAAAGTGANPPLMFVHGWGSSRKFWKHAMPWFASRHYCIAPDLPGWGLSDKPDIPYTMEAYVGYLANFLDALNLRRVELVGHSMGGTISLLFALTHPDRVSKLTIVNPLIQGSTAFFWRTRVLTLPIIRTLVYWLSKIRAVRTWVAKDFSHVMRLEPDLVDDVALGTYRSSLEPILSMSTTDLSPRLSELRMPVLLIGTDRDLIINPQQHELLHPAAQYARITETGHIPMLERPEQFNRVLESFLHHRG